MAHAHLVRRPLRLLLLLCLAPAWAMSITRPTPADAAGAVRTSYGWHPEHSDSTYPLYARVPESGAPGQRYVYFHNDHLGTPWRITDKAGSLVWSAVYDGFGRATVSVPASGAVQNHLRYPGQYFDAETGLHYNDRRFYDPDTGRYLTRDPLGFGGGTNLYAYAAHNPTNLIDPSGEILPCLAANYVRCMAACMLMSAAEDYFLECGNVDWGDNAKECAVDCLWSMLPIPNPCSKFGKWLGMGLGVAGAAGVNSFTAETLVHVMPAGASDEQATLGQAVLKPIGELQLGDKVLALAEWKERGAAVKGNARLDAKADCRLAYERITDIYTSRKEQVLVHLTLDNGEQLTATEGHPFKTSEGWRDAVLLKRGGKLLLKGSGDGDGSERVASIADVRVERLTVQVFNLEVANAHTFFVGNDGALVHNGVRQNWTDGKNFEGSVADALTNAGRTVERGGPGIRTPFGWRFPDMRVYDSGGDLLGLVECKKGKLTYHNSQRNKAPRDESKCPSRCYSLG